MAQADSQQRRLPVGAEVVPHGGVGFRVWAPRPQSVEVLFDDHAAPDLRLTGEGNGYFSGIAPAARAGMNYRFRLDGGTTLHADPASRFQPRGPHGPSQVVDPAAFRWTDHAWRGLAVQGQVLYEMHVGTFTTEGTWDAAIAHLPQLQDLGITCIEMMPVADFVGRWGWGYDGVNLFAPTHLYGRPDDLRRFVDRAHGLGIGVILDVVYNHLGPDGSVLHHFAKEYFNVKHTGEWGPAINFGGPGSEGVREFFIANARHWIEEYHVDGFRFDATQAIADASATHILAEIAEAAKRAAGARGVLLISENEPQEMKHVRGASAGGYAADAIWNDDFHHSANVALTGLREAYCTDFQGRAQEFVSAAKRGTLYQGQFHSWYRRGRGTPALDLPPTAFVNFLENHDTVGNFGRGERLQHMTSPALYRAMVGLWLLMPQTPMLFQGQEFGSTARFCYFADHHAELMKLVCKGRAKQLAQFPCLAHPATQAAIPSPADPATFVMCKIDHRQREHGLHAQTLRLFRDLLQLRRRDAALAQNRPGSVDGAVIGPHSFVLRFFDLRNDDRLLVVNLGADEELPAVPEPLLAPPEGKAWDVLWCSQTPEYGGQGQCSQLPTSRPCRLAGQTTTLFHPVAPAPRT